VHTAVRLATAIVVATTATVVTTTATVIATTATVVTAATTVVTAATTVVTTAVVAAATAVVTAVVFGVTPVGGAAERGPAVCGAERCQVRGAGARSGDRYGRGDRRGDEHSTSNAHEYSFRRGCESRHDTHSVGIAGAT
jgi:hypothetical protein